ncbi:hypothetical protein QJS10_CPB17g00644 [Acorus calamus]|uniref:Uncharacterized protein n=1 Tax=Acorus calamus TaxID=4465 RepID=A0AAV9CUZ0_ACOCL|nr:hypothetical protein QJS10_CPB17g00644 [Acorus calamus]
MGLQGAAVLTHIGGAIADSLILFADFGAINIATLAAGEGIRWWDEDKNGEKGKGEEIHHRLLSLENTIHPIRTLKNTLLSIDGHIDHAVGPAMMVLLVFDAVHKLERLLLSDHIRSDLPGYLSILKNLKEALRFLFDNCGLTILWFDDIVEYLKKFSSPMPSNSRNR